MKAGGKSCKISFVTWALSAVLNVDVLKSVLCFMFQIDPALLIKYFIIRDRPRLEFACEMSPCKGETEVDGPVAQGDTLCTATQWLRTCFHALSQVQIQGWESPLPETFRLQS